MNTSIVILLAQASGTNVSLSGIKPFAVALVGLVYLFYLVPIGVFNIGAGFNALRREEEGVKQIVGGAACVLSIPLLALLLAGLGFSNAQITVQDINNLFNSN